MISRVADHCFWVGRYIERAESTARLLQVTRALAFDAELPPLHCWRPLMIVSGQFPEFSGHFGADAAGNGDIVQRYMTWAPENPVSIRTSVRSAREGARSIREVLGHEIWQATNELYVADGYGNKRVIVYDADSGAYKRHWGAYGHKPDDSPMPRYDPNGPPAQQFRNPVHCAELSNDGLLYVCDRVNDRIQVFKSDGTFVKEQILFKNTLGDAAHIIDATANLWPGDPVAGAKLSGQVNGASFLATAPDADGDGIPDCDDACPGTPAGAGVDATGCSCPDADGDGYGNSDSIKWYCSLQSGYVIAGGDCNDANAAVHPGACEIYFNSIDEDCNGVADDCNAPSSGFALLPS